MNENIEIERKFLTTSDVPWDEAIKVEKITQGYMLKDDEKTIRIRLVEELKTDYGIYAYLTVKGKTTGYSRVEIESRIDFGKASDLLAHFCKDSQIIEKVRYYIPDQHGQIWEVDRFRTNNKGLVIAELELTSDDQEVILPIWVSGEVTNDKRYSNSSLSRCPFPFEFDPNVLK